MSAFNRQLPSVNILTIGHTGHGKSTLTAALTRVCSEVFSGSRTEFDVIDAAPASTVGGIPLRSAHVKYTSHRGDYLHTDAPATECGKAMLAHQGVNGALLVVSAVDGPGTLTGEHIRLARNIGIPSIVVFLNHADKVDDAGKLEAVEKQIRSLLSTHDFPGDETPVIVGSALTALNGEDGNELGTTAVRKLVEALDTHIPRPKRPSDEPLLMPIEGVFTLRELGTTATGTVERGVLKFAEVVDIVGWRSINGITVTGLEMFRKPVDEAQRGDGVAVGLRGVKREDIERGHVLAKPGSIKPYTKFTSEVYLLSQDEGGRAHPFVEGSSAQFHFHTADVAGSIELPDGTGSGTPGDSATLKVSLIKSIAMERGQRFKIREDGKTVGVGVVADVIE